MERANVPAGAERLAVVGFAFRFPGPPGEGFWTALCEGRNLIGTVDPARWSAELFHHPRRNEPGTAYTRAAGSLGDIGGFDAGFFGISPREAARLDPQQRLLLELSWEAFESGGIAPASVRGSRSSVHIGFSGSDYGQRSLDDMASVDAFSMTGVAGSIAANRISYFFDLRGPSMALDTACSSSHVAFHQACRSLLHGDAQLALTGAVYLQLHPFPFVAFSKASMLSKRGICSPFDADGDGYVRAEGAAVMLLKRLDQAIAEGNRIYAVIAGSALNCDGKTNGLTVPSCEAQAALLRDVYSQACIDPAEIDYFEAHGTGTPVGDPIEARAIGEALGKQRAVPLPIGSVKSNLGHLETAAGMAGLVKAIYCLRHRTVPPSINFRKPNPHIAFRDWNLEVVTATRPLDPEKRLVIGVNSFGFGGANAHVILESPPQLRAPRTRQRTRPAIATPIPLRISARSEAALRESARRHAEWLRSRNDLKLYDIAYTAAFHRDWHEHRAIAVAEDRATLAAALESFAAGNETPGIVPGRALAEPRGPVFLYSGNGSQWAGMGRKLLAEDAVFRKAVAGVDECWKPLGGFSLNEMLQSDDAAALLEATEHAQPLLFAVQVGLTEMLRERGIEPAAVAGHSVGEIAAAWACGALTLEQACEVVYQRSHWQATTRGAGAMTAVAASENAVRELLLQDLSLAAVNSPTGVTVSGPAAALEAFEAQLRAHGISYKRLGLDYAFHSAAMAPIEDEIRRALDGLQPGAAKLPFYSTVAGARLEGEVLDAGYWWRNIREPVQFKRVIDALAAERATVFVEIGPHAVLRAYVAECLRSASVEGRLIPAMTRSADGAAAVRDKAFQIMIAGAPARLEALYPDKGRMVDLPGYPWQRERHWYSPTGEGLDLINRRALHPLLGHRLPLAEGEWENHLDTTVVPALADHRVGGEALLPASAYAEIAFAAASEHSQTGIELSELEIRAPLALDAQRSKTLRFKLDAADGSFTLRSRERLSSDPWRLHAVGRLWASPASSAEEKISLPQEPPLLAAAEHYSMTRAVGLDYGPAFQLIDAVWRDGDAVVAKLKTPDLLVADSPSLLHPASLDACFQLLIHVLRSDASTERVAFVPVKLARVVLHAPYAEARFARLAVTRRGARAVIADAALYDSSGAAIATLQGVRFRAVALGKSPPPLTFLATRAVAQPGKHVFSLERLAEVCRQRLHAPARLQARERYFGDVEPLLEAMLVAFAKEALAHVRQTAPAREALLQRLTEAVGDAEYPEAREIWSQLLGDHPDHASEIIWLGRLGSRLAEMLAGAEWLPPPFGPESQFSQAIADVVAEMLRALPAERRIRILALDAGHSPCLPRALAELDTERCDCVILCLQAALVEERKALAARYPGVVVRAADLNDAQGECFDLIIAEEGLTWTDEPEQAAAKLRSLCADDGVLVLAEQQPSPAVALARELLGAADPSFAAARGEPPSGDSLGAMLEHCGFAAESVIPEAPEIDFGSYLVLARAHPKVVAEEAPRDASRYLICEDAGGFAELLARELESAGATVRRIAPQPDVAGWKKVFSEPVTIDRVVYLGGLGAPLAEAAARCESAGALLEACTELAIKPECWIVTLDAQRRPEEAPLWGYARAAINEYPGIPLRIADLALPESPEKMARALADVVRRPDAEDELVLSNAGPHVVRLQPVRAPAVPGAAAKDRRSIVRLGLGAGGQLKQLAWTRQTLAPPADDEVEIEVRAAGLNFRDVMFAMGQLPDEALENGFAGPSLGMEMSGIVLAAGPRVQGLHAGQEVIAFAPASFASRVVTKADAVIKKPAAWSFEAAATVPAAFLTAYYAVHHLGRLEHGQRILIHGAAGGVGIAAIQLAQMAGAEIYATAGSDVKRDFLRLLGVDHALDSRSLAFADEVMRRSGGEGVDVVLNSLAGEAMSRSLGVLKPFGRFLELGKRDFYENTRLGLRPFRNNIAFFGIDADQLMLERPELTRRLMQELMALFRQGRLKPLPYTLFPATDAVEAFRYMQQSKQIGKIVLGFDPPPAPQAAGAAAPALRLRPDATYLVAGGLRGFGLRTAQWLAGKGARNLVLVSKNLPNKEAQDAIAALEADGVRVKAAACDVADRAALAGLLAEIRASMPPLRGVVHAAAVLHDGLIRNLTRSQIEQVFAPKIQGAANLDQLTREARLDFFVLYSSATTLFGNPGQAAYVAANRYLEVLAEQRRARGLPALCMSWGPIGDAGFLERHPEIRKALEGRMGAVALASDDALAVLEQSLLARATNVAVVSFDRHGVPRMLAAARSPKFRPLLARFEHSGAAADSESVQRWLAELDDEQLAVLFTDLVKREIGTILRMPPEHVDPQRPLQDLGLDSLMGVELMTAVEARFGVNIPVMAMSEVSTVERLAKRIVKELRRAASEPAPEESVGEQVRALAAQHAPEVTQEQIDAFTAEFKVTAK
jgi:acyl transferase domain-containing protein/NADPH:quinone reductase-like Zn-dependent oxidoreductase/acyl carrier protein/short-subunit dehydrogenase